MKFNIADAPKLIGIAASVVGLIEKLFSRKKGAGPRKRAKAVRQITALFGYKAANLPPGLVGLIGALVDVLGKNVGDFAVVERVQEVFTIVSDTITLTRGLINDDEETKRLVVEFVNGEVDLPGISEDFEKVMIGLMVDAIIAGLPPIDDDIPF